MACGRRQSSGRTNGDRVSNPLQIYFHAINETPLLSRQEERVLAERIAAGDPYARDHMIQGNLRLVVNIARSQLGQGLSLEDLIEEGNLGLMRAVESFDGSMDTKFSTYASYWIKQSMRRAVMKQGKFIRLPDYMVKLLKRWKQKSEALLEQLGRPPTDKEMGKELRLSKRRIKMVQQALAVPRDPITAPEDADSGYDFLDLAANDRPPEEISAEHESWELVRQRLDKMDPNEAAVIKLRFGLGETAPLTLREVGERLGFTRERARQIEARALSRLRVQAPGLHSPSEEEPRKVIRLTTKVTDASNASEPEATESEVLPPPENGGDTKARQHALRGVEARRASGRRSRIDPATCDRQQTQAECEFGQAMMQHAQHSGRRVPSTAEILSVLEGLGYRASATINSDKAPELVAEGLTAYKAQSGRSFPTWSEHLEVLTSLGYQKPEVTADSAGGVV